MMASTLAGENDVPGRVRWNGLLLAGTGWRIHETVMRLALIAIQGGNAVHATRASMRVLSKALPRRRALCTNWKKPR
jgi:hypothetical protein